MKIILFLLLLLPLGVVAQEFKEVSGGFAIKGTETGRTLTVEGKVFDIMITNNGAEYIEGYSESKMKFYPIWLGKETGKSFNGLPVRQTSTGKFFYLKISKNGNPYQRYLQQL